MSVYNRNTLGSRRNKLYPLLGLGQVLQRDEACLEETTHVSREKEMLGDRSQRPEWRTVVEHIANEGALASGLKEMIVIEVRKRAAHLTVAKVKGRS